MDDVFSNPRPQPVDRDCADAYAAFWQCIEADDAPPARAIDPDRSAYEQFWISMDADGFSDAE